MKKILTLIPLLFAAPLMAQGESNGPPDGGLWQVVTMIAITVLFFYFILWRPEQRRRKLLDEQRSSLKQGDKVVAMGIVGHVQRVQEQTVILKMYDGAKIEMLKGAITEVIDEAQEKKE